MTALTIYDDMHHALLALCHLVAKGYQISILTWVGIGILLLVLDPCSTVSLFNLLF